jgi:2-polyprenyl-3-methyl-5-hydroxy-6-metoxy-1,4-benzoquinol methylase
LKILAVVQCIDSDVFSTNPDDCCISPLKKSKVFDDIVLAVPKLGNYSIFEGLSKKWNVGVFFGSNYNVAERIYNATKNFEPDIVVRILLRRFYIDMDLINSLILKLQEGYDYINLDNNVYSDVSADVCTFSALKRAVELIKELPDDYKSNSFRFNPWRFMEVNSNFKIFTFSYKKKWNDEKIKFTREKIKNLMKQEDEAQPVDSNEPINRYRFISQFIEKTDNVLDIACGEGSGTKITSDFAKEVYGIDYDKKYIADAKLKFSKPNLKFILGSDELLEGFGEQFDKVICTHTLEHVSDDKLFLRRIRNSLKPNGKLILEVPRLCPYPIGKPLWPDHKREYEKDSLEKLIQKVGFEIESAFGGNRRDYVNVSDARDAFLYVCKKSN